MIHEVPTLPVVLPLAAATFVVLVWRLHRRGAVTAPRVALAAAVCAYGAGIVANTVLPFELGATGARPPWRVFLHLTPLAGTDARDMLQNVVVFVPLGVLVPLVTRVRSATGVLAVGFLVSLGMEAVQLVNAVTGHGGHIADVNDLLANTLGAPIGYAVYRIALLVPPVRRLAAATASHLVPR